MRQVSIVDCRTDPFKFYPTKIKVSDAQMAELDLLRHPILPNWNYTLTEDKSELIFARALSRAGLRR
jgi:hypothetical protein